MQPNDLRDQFEQEINIQELLQVLWSKKHIIGVVAGFVMALVILYHFTATPEYRSPSVVLVKSEKNPLQVGLDPVSSFVGGLKNDIELIQSFPLAEDVVRQLSTDPDRPKLELFSERTYVSPLGTLFSWVPSVKKTQAKRDPEVQLRAWASALQGRITVVNARDTDILTVSVSSPFPEEAALLTNALAKAYSRKDIEWNADQATQIRNFVGEQLEAQKQEIAAVDQRLSAYMQQQNIYELTGNAQNLLDKLVEAESRHNDARSEYNILQKRQDFIAQRLSAEEKAFMVKVSKNVEQQSRELKSKIREQESALLGREKDDPATRSMREQLQQLKQRLVDITRNSIAGELAYNTKARQFQFDLISEQLQIDVRLAELNYIAQEFARVKDTYNAQLGRLPKKQLDFARLQRDREVLNNTYSFLKGKFEESRIKIASEVGKVVIVGIAYPPLSPVAPNLKKNLLIGLILGLGLGGTLVFVLEMLDHSLKDNAFLEEHGFIPLAAIPFVPREGESIDLRSSFRKALADVAAILPGIGSSGSVSEESASGTKRKARLRASSAGKRLPEQGERKPLLMFGNLTSPFAESFRDLRTNVMFSQADRSIKSLLVTGSEVNEGKSTVCANLGAAFALMRKRVLIIDCDMRRPSQHRNFGCRRVPGLSDYLAGVKDDVQPLVQQVAHHENLFLLSAGTATPNPNELLGSQKMSDMLKAMEDAYDVVLLDTPPVMLLSDAALLSRTADGVLMVVRMGYTNKHLLREVQKIEYLKQRLLGVAIIGSMEAQGNGRYGRYYGRYGYKGYYGYSSYSQYLDPEKTDGPKS